MKYLGKIACFLAFSSMLNACMSISEPVENPVRNSEINHSIQIEPHKGRITPQVAAARAVKYNLENLKKQAVPKFLGSDARENAFSNLNKLKNSQNPNIASSLKELDFAILYTSLNIETSQDKMDALLNQETTKNLILGSIKAHKNAMFAHKKIPEINKKIRQYQKQIEIILKKKSEEEAIEQKNLENSIDRLRIYLNAMEQDINDYRQLVKLQESKTDMEGKAFFETNKLPPQSKSSPYQQAAFNNRLELKDIMPSEPEKIAQTIANQYPEQSSPVKGVFIKDSAYEQTLIARGDAQASVLLQTTLNYQKASSSKKEKLKTKTLEEMQKAIYLQIELAHYLAQRTNSDYETQLVNIKELQKNVHKLEKTHHPTTQQKEDLYKATLDLFENEILADQILAERTLAAVALKFYSGQIYITPELLTKDISQIASFFNASLTKKINSSVEKPFLSKQTSEENNLTEEHFGWAHRENWLEEVINESSSTTLKSNPISGRLDFNAKTILQLGAFLDKEAALKEWEIVSSKMPELKKFQPLYEQTSIAGIRLYRLIIKSPTGGFKGLCSRLRQNNHECVLRD